MSSTLSQLITSSSVSPEKLIEENLFQLIIQSKKSIKISNPYFYPSSPILKALKIIAISGVNIQLLLPKNPSPFSSRLLNHLLYGKMLKYGVEINEYFGFNHDKFFIFDDEKVFFGTSNLDHRSLFINYEYCLLIKDLKLVGQMNALFKKLLLNSHRIDFEDGKKKGHYLYFLHNVFVKLVRGMV